MESIEILRRYEKQFFWLYMKAYIVLWFIALHGVIFLSETISQAIYFIYSGIVLSVISFGLGIYLYIKKKLNVNNSAYLIKTVFVLLTLVGINLLISSVTANF